MGVMRPRTSSARDRKTQDMDQGLDSLAGLDGARGKGLAVKSLVLTTGHLFGMQIRRGNSLPTAP
jgi:hypothetical protein